MGRASSPDEDFSREVKGIQWLINYFTNINKNNTRGKYQM